MSFTGPKDIAFLYRDRLNELFTGKKGTSAPSVAVTPSSTVSKDKAVEDLTLKLTSMSIGSSIKDDIDLNDIVDLLPEDNDSDQLSRLEATTKAADIFEHKLGLMDFLINRAGYTAAGTTSKEEYSAQYRDHFEQIINEDNGIFQIFYLQVKEILDAKIEQLSSQELGKVKLEQLNKLLKNDKKQELKTYQAIEPYATQIKEYLTNNKEKVAKDIDSAVQKQMQRFIKESREEALKALGPEYFSKLGQYFSANNKFYFEQNPTATELSNHFLQTLYSDPKLTEQMIQAHHDKTAGIYEGMKESFTALLPITFYADVEDLKSVEDNFDLFLASPTVLLQDKRIAPNSPLGKAVLISKDRAAQLSAIKGNIDPQNIKFSVYHKGENFYVDTKLSQLKIISEKYKIDISEELEQLSHFKSPVEKVFYFQKNVLNNVIKLLDDEHAKSKVTFETSKARLSEKEESLQAEYLRVNHQGKSIDALRIELKAKIKDVFEGIKKNRDENGEYKALYEDFKEISDAQSKKDKDIRADKRAFDSFKSEFIKTFYPELIQVAKSLTISYKELSKAHAAKEKVHLEGATYSCLSFVPVKISAQGQADRYECLVAMSGVELNKEPNPHKILAEHARSLSLDIDGKPFTFRYVDASADKLTLQLLQIGKGLSGRPEPLSTVRNEEILPSFDKLCAEKRLVKELMVLFSQHGEQVQVLGCDNIALPTAKQLRDEFQKQLPALNADDTKFDIKARLASATSAATDVTLRAEHIPCCDSCQAQKPAVFTVLYSSMQQSQRLRQQQQALLAVKAPVKSSQDRCNDEVIADVTRKVDGLKVH